MPALLAGVTFVDLAPGYDCTLARCSDGSVAAWGETSSGQFNLPALPAGQRFLELAAGGYHVIGRYGP